MKNAYDFDGTIYDGDSSMDFYLYCLKRKPSLIIFLPIQLYGILLYFLKIKNKDFMKEKIFSFLKKIENLDSYVEDFWKKNTKKIKPWYLEQKKKSDIIISASPEFLLKHFEDYLNIDKVIATKVNKKTGKFESKNCHDYEKIKRYEEIYGKKKINEFYSDSVKADRAMLEYAKKAYLVKKDKVEEIDIKNYKEEKFNYPLYIAINILLFISILSIVPSILYIFKIPVNKLYFPLTLIILIIINYFISKKSLKKTILLTFISFFIIFISIAICFIITDTSVDGNSYRKIMSGLMREGWNPVYQSAKSFNYKTNILPNKLSSFGNKSQWFWMDVYPKGLATMGACISIITKYIETGKCYTILTMFILYFLSYLVLNKYLNKKQSFLLSLIIALNPVSLCQLRTFYVDAALCNFILIAIALSILYYRKNKTFYLYLISLCIINVFSIKFNGMLYIGITCILMWLIQLFKDKKEKDYKKSKTIFIIYAVSVVLSILINYSPYITNITRYHEFLPGITGNSTKATGNITASTVNLNSVEVFYANIFSKVGDFWYQPELPLKLPFTFTKEEINNYEIHASNFGTFGMLFGGIFIIVNVLGIYLIYKNRKIIFKNESLIIFLFVLSVYLESLFSPIGYGGLRYVGHFYIIVPYILGLLLYFIEQNKNTKQKRMLKGISYIIVLLIVFNLLPYLKVYYQNAQIFKFDRYQLTNIKKSLKDPNRKLKVALSTDSSHGLLLNMRDYGIKYGDYKLVAKEDLKGNINYTCVYQIRFVLE